MDDTTTYLISIGIFVVLPLIIYVYFSYYLRSKIDPEAEYFERENRTRKMPKDLKKLIRFCYVYIILNGCYAIYILIVTIKLGLEINSPSKTSSIPSFLIYNYINKILIGNFYKLNDHI